MKAAALLALAAVSLSACAGATGPSTTAATGKAPRQCFWNDSVSGFSSVDRDTIRVSAGVRDVYEMKLAGAGCNDVDWALAIGLRSLTGGRICTGLDAEVLYNSPGLGPQRCLVTDVRKVTEAELEAEKARK